MKFYNLLIPQLLSGCLCSYLLLVSTINRDAKICLSNTTPLRSLIEYWSRISEGLSMEDSTCSLGDSSYVRMSNKTIMNSIKLVQDSVTEIKLQCNMANNSNALLHFDGLSDSFDRPQILNCESKESLGDINYNPEYEIHNKDIKTELKSSDSILRDRVAELEERLRDETKLLNAERIIRDMEMNDHSERYYSNDVRMREHEEQVKNLDKMLVEKESYIARLQNNITSMISAIKPTKKAATLITAISLLSSAYPSPEMPHLRNRFGKGLYKTEEADESNCRPIDYGTACAGFEYIYYKGDYPFMKAHYHHRTLLEAYNDNLISLKSSNGLCKLDNTKGKACFDERAFIKASCPPGLNSAHYVDSKGKMRIVKCEDGNELTEDCVHCKKPLTGKQVSKSSVALQDAVCQVNSTQYNGPSIVPLGVCSIGNMKFKSCENGVTQVESMPFAIFQEQGKIYLDSLVVRNTDMVTKDSFLCYDRVGQVDGSDTSQTTTNRMKKFDISKCKNVVRTGDKHCAGDEVFCSQYNCEGDYPAAQCVFAKGSGPIELFMSGVWVRPICLGYEKVSVRREIKPQILKSQSECLNCVADCKIRGIVVRSTGFRITSAIACSHGSCVSKTQEPNTEILVPYPGMSASTGGDIGIHLSHDDGTISNRLRVFCEPRDLCEAHSCMFCLEALINYQCHTFLSGLMVAMFVVSMIAVLVSGVAVILKVFRISPRILALPIVWLSMIFRWIATGAYIRLSTKLRNLNNEIGWNDNNIEGVIVQGGNPRFLNNNARNMNRHLNRYMYTIGILLFMICSVHPCSEIALASSKMTKCTSEKSKTNCKVSGSLLLKAGIIGSDTCLLIKGRSDTQQTLISIKTESSEIVCRQGQDFWTGQFSPKCMSSRRCHGVGECIDQICQAWTDNKTSQEFSGISKNQKMVENKCIEQCGGFGCGCFNINPSCLFVHAEYVSNRKEAIRVFNCIDWVHRLTLKVTDSQGDSEIITLGSMETKFFKWGSLTLSLDAEAITGSSNLLFMQNHAGGFSLADEQFSDIPREGFIGEIRCGSEAAVTSAHSSCKKAPNLIKYKPVLDYVECSTNLIDPFTMFLRGSLPQTRNGKTFTSSKDQKTVQALANAQVNAQISLTIDDYEVEFKEEGPSCEATFLNLTGCYSCNHGARVCLRVSIISDGIFSSHNEDNSLNMAFHVKNNMKEYCQILHFDTPHVDEQMTYTCGSDERPINIRGSLISIMPFDFRNQSDTVSTIVNPVSTGWSLSNWGKGLMNWLGGPLKTMGLIILYIGLSILGLTLLIYIFKVIILSYIKKIASRKSK
ncbi:Glycoprotein precursor [Cacao virus]|uniref:Envelopment polyprotein n=1 Tax=Cacao virus TaxID=629730 RepID=A0A4P8D7U2_9VIRU|nr:Glycoprotein precursor [Cacao virus]QCI62732.1 Glycoprotein precursor [Cacao virus]